MFSKLRKHLNIMWLLLITLTIMLGIVFVGIISIDKYCEENVLENVQSEEEVTSKGLNSLARNIAITLDSIQITLRYEPDAMNALQSVMSSTQKAVQDSDFDNCIGIINNTYYNTKAQVETTDINFKRFDWFQGACRQQDGTLYVSAPYKDDFDGQYYIAFAKYVKSGRYVIAVCIKVDNLKKYISTKSGGYGYLVNINGEVIVSRDDENLGVNVSTGNNTLPKGHDEVFGKIDSIGKKTIVETRVGDMYASKYVVVSGLDYVIIREEGKIINNVDGVYLKVIITIIMVIPIIIGLFMVGRKYSRRITEVYANKCEFIEGLAIEMKIPLETIRIASNELLESGLEDNAKKNVDTILESTKAIAFDLNSAYDYSKLAVEQLIIENEEYTIERILRNVESVVHSDVQKNNIYFDCIIEGNSKLKLYGDNRKIEEIIINTVKYCASQTIEGGIELKVMYADLTTDSVNVMLVIKDTGVGMNDTELSVFVEGLRAYTNEMEVEHSGIGLEMVKHLLKLLNGKVNVDSTKNVGSLFTIMIPQKIVIGDDSKWENEDVRTSSELTQLYGRLEGRKVDYSYLTKGVGEKSTKVEPSNKKENKNSSLQVKDKEKEIKTKKTNDKKETKIDKNIKENTEKVKVENTEKGMNTLFGKKVKRLEDMIPQPELIENSQENNSFDDEQDDMFNNQSDMFNSVNNGFGSSNDMFDNEKNSFGNDMISEAPAFGGMNSVGINDMAQNFSDEYKHIEYQPEPMVTQNIGYQPEPVVSQNVQYQPENSIQQSAQANVNPPHQSVTQYLGEEEKTTDTSQEKEEDLLEKQMRQQMEAQADNLYEQMTKRELNEINSQEQIIAEEVQEVTVQDARIDLLKNTIGQCGMDIDKILTEYDNDIDSYEKTLLEFYEYSRKNANNVVLLWNQKQFNEYFSAIDTIKAGAEAIGAYNLVNMFNIQLQKGSEGDLKYVAGTIMNTLNYWKQLLAAIAQFEKSRNSL